MGVAVANMIEPFVNKEFHMEKEDDFENRPSCKGYSPCKGYSLYKMGSLGEKLKMRKTILLQNYGCSVKKKPLQKNTKYWRNKTILKIGHLAKAIAHANRPSCKGYSLCKMGSLGQILKLPKTCEPRF